MTTAAGQVLGKSIRCVFAGQSLNNQPLGNAYPDQLMARYPGIQWVSIGLAGVAWLQLVDADKAPGRLDRWASLADVVILFQCGGTTDYNFAQTGAQVYSYEQAHAATARAKGYDWVIGSTTNPTTTHDATESTQRQAGNALVLADAAGAFTEKVDFAQGDPRLTDPANTTYYVDGTHPTAAGATIMADLAQPALDRVLARL